MVLQSEIYTDSGRKRAYLKLLPTEEIAKEALCWALARTLGLPIPQAFYVVLYRGDVEGFPDIAERLPGNPEVLAFGLEEAGILHDRIENRRAVESRLDSWDQALACGVFDEWIVNGDRIPNNLLFAGRNNFVLIDHDDALPSYASTNTHSISNVLKKLSEGKTEFVRYSLLRDAEEFLNDIQHVDFQKILQAVLHENVLDIDRSFFSKHIEFLRQRSKILPKIVSMGLLSRLTGLMLDDGIEEEKERYR